MGVAKVVSVVGIGINGDVLTVATAFGSFDAPAAGSGKTVSIAGLTLGGASAGNYTLVNNSAATRASIIDPSKLAGRLWPVAHLQVRCPCRSG